MGKINKGILGGFSGTVGTVVGGNWKGIDYMRSLPVIKKKSDNPARLVQQAKFGLATKFLSSLSDLVKISFRDFANKMTGPNSALSYTLKNAVSGIYPDLQLDYPLALVSRGSLPNASTASVTADRAATINFTWEDNTGTGSAKKEDQAILVAYCPELKKASFTMAGGSRETGVGTLKLSNEFSGKEVHTWLSFVSTKNKDIASSIYTGKVTIQ